MKILQICAAYSELSGGVSVHVHDLVYSIVGENREEQHQVHIITAGNNTVYEEIKISDSVSRINDQEIKETKKGGNVVSYEMKYEQIDNFSGRRLFQDDTISFSLRRLSLFSFDIIHVHDWDSLFIGLVISTAWNIPIILTHHRSTENWYLGREHTTSKDAFMEFVKQSNKVQKIVVPSNASAKVLGDQGFPDVVVIPHGTSRKLGSYAIETEILEKYKLPSRDNSEIKIILCPVRAESTKNPEILLEAAPDIIKQNSDNNLLFVFLSNWKGKYFEINSEILEFMAAKKNLKVGKDVLFLQQIPWGRELATVIKNSYLVVIPSLHESFGLSVLDAFTCLRPVVARNSNALCEIVQNEKNGLLFNNQIDLVAQISKLLVDNSLYNNIINNALLDIKDNSIYSRKRMARDYINLYKNVIFEYKQKRAA